MKTNNLLTMLMTAATAVVLTTACSSDTAEDLQTTTREAEPVSFSAYLNRGTTRAGAAGTLTTEGAGGTVSLKTQGFGVFGYYGDGVLYNQNLLPNFMYNEKVAYSDDAWNYSPVKYWPNEFGNGARSAGIDRLTFFAYAPWVEVSPSTGSMNPITTTGITRLTRATDTGDPYVHYVVNFDPANQVDLCWGVAQEDYTSKVGDTDAANNVAKGKPYIDVSKPEYDKRIKYRFMHALSALNVTIKADVDADDTYEVGDGKNGDSETGAKFTRVWVRSVTFEGFATEGALNLNNPETSFILGVDPDPDKWVSKPYWRSDSRTSSLSTNSIIINDGRLDGYEGSSPYTYETPIVLNPQIVQGHAYSPVAGNILQTTAETAEAGSEPGVLKTAVNLFDISALDPGLTPEQKLAAPVFVIPNSTLLKVTVAYDVETYDEKVGSYLSDGVTHGTSIENIITANTGIVMAAGKKYTLNLILGLTSVKATVTEIPGWDNESADDVELPVNKQSEP